MTKYSNWPGGVVVMLTNDDEILANLKSLQLTATYSIADPNGLRYYTLALLGVATKYGVEQRFITSAKYMMELRNNDQLLPLPAAN
jgi:hypothetical protein